MHAVCLAYRNEAWRLLSRGSKDVGEDLIARVCFGHALSGLAGPQQDMKSHYYGRRGVVWMRLVHKDTGSRLPCTGLLRERRRRSTH